MSRARVRATRFLPRPLFPEKNTSSNGCSTSMFSVVGFVVERSLCMILRFLRLAVVVEPVGGDDRVMDGPLWAHSGLLVRASK